MLPFFKSTPISRAILGIVFLGSFLRVRKNNSVLAKPLTDIDYCRIDAQKVLIEFHGQIDTGAMITGLGIIDNHWIIYLMI